MAEATPAPEWFVYLLVSTTGTRTYVGVTTDVERRLAEHNGEQPGGARSTRAGRPWRILARSEALPDRSTACRLEHHVKRARGAARERRIREGLPADESSQPVS